MKLYRAWSVVDNWRGRDEVTLNLFVANRRKPVAPYRQLIKEYDPAHYSAQWDEDYVNELFTESELEMLIDFCRKRLQSEPHYELVQLPVEKGGNIPLASIPFGKHNDTYYFSSEKGYSLPFELGAYFELIDCPLTVVPDVWYLKAAFEALNLPQVEEKALREAARKVHEEHSLYVITEKPIL